MLLLAGILTDLVVEPCFQQHQDDAKLANSGRNAKALEETPTNAPKRVSDRSQTGECCCWRWSWNAGPALRRSRQTTDLIDTSSLRACS